MFRYHAALCAAAVGACAAPLDPIEDGLAVEVPERYASEREGAFEGVPWDGPWWHAAVQDAELDALVARCLEQNFELEAQIQTLRQARANARAAGAPFLPTLDVGGSVQDLVIEDNTAAGALIPVRQGQVYSLGPSLSWELDLFGRIDAAQDAAALGAEASEADVHALRLTLTGSVYEAWLDAVENRALEALALQQVATNEELLELRRAQFAGGSGTALSILQQERQLESTRAELPGLRGARERASYQLSVLVGEAPQDNVQRDVVGAGSSVPPLPALPTLDVPGALLTRRPDLVAEGLRVRSLDRSVAAAVAARYPRLSLTGSYNFDATDAADLFDRTIQTLVGNLTLPLTDGGALRAEAERARAELAGALATYNQSFLVALREVEDALSVERRGVEFEGALERQLEIGRAEIDQARRAFAGGRSNYLPVLDAVRSVQTLERQLVTQRVANLRARGQLLRALGGATEDAAGAAADENPNTP
ncbi:MAG: efflux transporter outer membrane subunit [Planctomycetota bacterium]